MEDGAFGFNALSLPQHTSTTGGSTAVSVLFCFRFPSNVLPHTPVRSSVWLEGAIWPVPSERLSFPTFLSLSCGLNWTVSSAIAGLCHLAMHRNCLFSNKYRIKWVREAIFAESRSHRKSVRFTADICLAQIPWAPSIGRFRRCEQYPRQDWLDDCPSPCYHPQEAIEQGKVFSFSHKILASRKWQFGTFILLCVSRGHSGDQCSRRIVLIVRLIQPPTQCVTCLVAIFNSMI